ncbi:MAG: TonB-dependent receptor [Desulfobacteraceae bacterium]
MKKRFIALMVIAVITGLPVIATAADEALQADEAQKVEEEVIVTGVATPTTKLSSSNSVTALPADDIGDYAPRSTAEIFRNLPGIQSESSSGDANANIKVRGLPISAGGSRYLSIQEDGFPALLIGDLEFATSDSFIRFDNNVRSVQSIRGGAGATQAANSPGGIVNFLSKTGDEQGGSVGATVGLDYDSRRFDINYGEPLDNDWFYHVGGYFRKGEGPRDVPDDMEQGYQVRANVTKEMDRGFVRALVKVLDDRAPTYMPIFARWNGSDYEEVGTDFGDGTPHMEGSDVINREDGRERTSLTKGFEAVVNSIGFEGEFDVAESATLGFKARYADISGHFVAPFPAQITDNGDGTYDASYHYFNTKLDSLDNIFADFNAKYKSEYVNIKGGLYYATQEYDAQWGWNQYDTECGGDPADWDMTPGHPIWGNCCSRSYDIDITNMAPYLSATGDIGESITWDASVRHDMWEVDGTYAMSGPADADGYLTYGDPSPYGYDLAYTSYSLGMNYALNDDMAVFGNYSKGGSATAPTRVDTNFYDENGDLTDDKAGYSTVDMYELGYKFQGGNAAAYVTLFYAETEESGGYEVTSQTSIQNSYESKGVEVEGFYEIGAGFAIRGSITLTDAEITDSNTEANIGNKPRRQADYIFNITPSYTIGNHNVGLNFVGTDEVFVGDNNEAKFDAYMVTNLFYNWRMDNGISLGLNANNLLDEVGFTEGQEGGPLADGDLVAIRPINGRTVSLTLSIDL